MGRKHTGSSFCVQITRICDSIIKKTSGNVVRSGIVENRVGVGGVIAPRALGPAPAALLAQETQRCARGEKCCD